MFDQPGELQALLTVGGTVTMALIAAFGYTNSRITKVDTALHASSEAAREEMATVRAEGTVRQDKIWDALRDIQQSISHNQEAAAAHRTDVATNVATKADLHREVDRLANMLERKELAAGSD